MRRAALLVLFVFIAGCMAFAADEPKDAEDLVARHLAAIGSPAARAAAKSLGIDGRAAFHFLTGGGGGESRGTMRMASEPGKLRLMMDLNTPNYTGEDFLYDGSKVRIAGFVAGKKSMLGGFVDLHPELLKEGLFGGVLSTSWPLLDLSAHKAKLKFDGMKKVDGQELLELKYQPKKASGDEQIWLYFDPQTYRHVMTTYEVVIPVTGAYSINPNSTEAANGRQQQEGRRILTEKFGDFKTLDGITLPSTWTIELTDNTRDATSMRWEFTIASAVHVPIDPAAFKMK